MCRNIKPLFNFDPPTEEDEVRGAALQFVRKISGINKPSKANELPFLSAIEEITISSSNLLHSLVTNSSPKNRLEEVAKAHERTKRRFGT